MMGTLRILLAKDLRRAWRNPVRWLISLLIPFVITGLIGLAFSPRAGGGGGLGVVRLAIVDEDDSIFSRIFRGIPDQSTEDTKVEIDAQMLPRDEAMRRITNNEIAAVVIIPKGFTDDYLSGDTSVAIELIKNPAQAIHPAIVEEALGVLVTVLDAAARILGDDIAQWRKLLTEDGEFLAKVQTASQLLKDTGERLTPLRDYLAPPLVAYTRETRDPGAPEDEGQPFNLFAFLLIGMAAMFLLYMADNAMRDLYREEQIRTLERFRTVHEGLAVLIASKVLFAVVVLLIGAGILFGGGAVLFQIPWKQPLALFILLVCYAFFAAGFLGLIAALAGKERRADLLNNIIIMVVALAGGCMFPPDGLPAFIREGVMPWMPTAWFASAGRAIQGGEVSTAWMIAAGKLAVLGACTIGAAAFFFQRRLQKGIRL